MTPQECSAKPIKLRYNNIVNNNKVNNNIISVLLIVFPNRKINSFGQVKNKNVNNSEVFLSPVLRPSCFFSTVNQVLEALRLQRRCQGNMVMVPLALHAAACWEKD